MLQLFLQQWKSLVIHTHKAVSIYKSTGVTNEPTLHSASHTKPEPEPPANSWTTWSQTSRPTFTTVSGLLHPENMEYNKAALGERFLATFFLKVSPIFNHLYLLFSTEPLASLSMLMLTTPLWYWAVGITCSTFGGFFCLKTLCNYYVMQHATINHCENMKITFKKSERHQGASVVCFLCLPSPKRGMFKCASSILCSN